MYNFLYPNLPSYLVVKQSHHHSQDVHKDNVNTPSDRHDTHVVLDSNLILGLKQLRPVLLAPTSANRRHCHLESITGRCHFFRDVDESGDSMSTQRWPKDCCRRLFHFAVYGLDAYVGARC